MGYPSFNVGDVLTATDMNAVGLWLLQTQTVTSSSLVQFNNKFTTDYESYLLVYHVIHNTSTGELRAQLQDASNNAIATGYEVGMGGNYQITGSATFGSWDYSPAGTTRVLIGGGVATAYCAGEMSFIGPRRAVPTFGLLSYVCQDYNTTYQNVNVAGTWTHNTATAYYGVRVFPSAGTITGTLSLYGRRN